VVAALTLHTAGAAGVPLAENLHEEALQAEHDCKPLMLEFSSSSCGYCQLLEEEVLNPTLLDHDYDRRVLMRKVMIDGAERLTDFDGRNTVNTSHLAARYQVHVTPTLLFVDSQGRELAERMVGVTTLDFYAGYLDAALDAAKKRLHALSKCGAEESY
jgi:thioredoxin-related protein